MQLQPRRPPGRADRKAGQYAHEITRLRGEGYTYAAIREALADVGVEVSASALRREVRRDRKQTPRATSVIHPRPVAATAAPVPQVRAAAIGLPLPPGATGREIAEAFFAANPSNPLLRGRGVQ